MLSCSIFCSWPRQASGLSLPGDDLAMVITLHCLETTEQRNWALARESSPGGWLLGADPRSSSLSVMFYVVWCGPDYKWSRLGSISKLSQTQTSLLTVPGVIVTGVNLLHFILPSQETHNLLCLSNLIIWLTLIISALVSHRGFGLGRDSLYRELLWGWRPPSLWDPTDNNILFPIQ